MYSLPTMNEDNCDEIETGTLYNIQEEKTTYKKKVSIDECKQALIIHVGHIGKAANHLKIGRATLHRYIADNPELKQQIELSKELAKQSIYLQAIDNWPDLLDSDDESIKLKATLAATDKFAPQIEQKDKTEDKTDIAKVLEYVNQLKQAPAIKDPIIEAYTTQDNENNEENNK